MGRRPTFADVKDGTSQTFLLAETYANDDVNYKQYLATNFGGTFCPNLRMLHGYDVGVYRFLHHGLRNQ